MTALAVVMRGNVREFPSRKPVILPKLHRQSRVNRWHRARVFVSCLIGAWKLRLFTLARARQASIYVRNRNLCGDGESSSGYGLVRSCHILEATDILCRRE